MLHISTHGMNPTTFTYAIKIIEVIEPSYILKCKGVNSRGEYQIICLNHNQKAICFISFDSGQRRSKFLKLCDEKFPIIDEETT